MLSPADGSSTAMVFSHGCSKVSKFSAVTKKVTESPRYIQHWLE
jgi:hypothetical protein